MMTEVTESQGSGSAAIQMEQPTRGSAPTWLMPTLVIAALLCGYVGENVITETQAVYYTEPTSTGFLPNEADLLALKNDMTRNFAIGFAAFGAIAIGVVGLIVGMSQSLVRAAVGFVLGAILGLVSGGIMGAAAFRTSDALSSSSLESMLQSIMIFGPTYLVLCIIASMLAAALCLQSKSFGSAILTGVKVGVAVTLLYLVISFVIVLITIGYADEIRPEHTGLRYTAYGLLAIGIAVAAGLTVGKAQPAPSIA